MSETGPQINPFPQIPTMPEERAGFAAAGEPKLPGAPEKHHESMLVARELGVEMAVLEKTGADLQNFGAITQTEKRLNFVREKFQQFYRNPAAMESFFDAMYLLQQTGAEYGQSARLFSQIFEDQFDKILARVETFSPEILGRWLEFSVKSPLYKDMAEKILKSLAAKGRTPKTAIDFLYDLALATIRSEDPMVFKRGVEILNFGTDIVPVKSRQHQLFLTAIYQDDDDLFKKQMEIDAFKTRYGLKLMPEVYKRGVNFERDAEFDGPVNNAVQKFNASHPNKFSELVKFYDRFSLQNLEPGNGTIVAVNVDAEKWPYNLVFHPGPLRQAGNEMLEKEVDNYFHLTMPKFGELTWSTDDQSVINKNILEPLNLPADSGNELTKVKDIECVFYLAPETITTEQRGRLVQENLNIRNHILSGRTHSISPRGDKMLIDDEALRALTFKSLTFQLGEPKTVTKVTVEVGNYNFIIELGMDLNLTEVNTKKSLGLSFERRAFLEHVILSYLKELQCSERVTPGVSDSADHTEALEREKEFTDRRGHRRTLPVGEQFTLDACRAAWKEQGWDLVKMNVLDGRTKETGQYTYVKIKENVRLAGGPLISRAPHAMDQFHSIVESPPPTHAE